MASPLNDPQEDQIAKHSATGIRDKSNGLSTSLSPRIRELPLRTSLVRDAVKKRIFAYMDQGDRSAAIEIKSGLSHLRVKHYRRMWKDERHDPRLRSKKRLRRKTARSRVPSSCEPIQLPLRMKSAGGRTPERASVVTGTGDRGKRKHRAARGLREGEANSRKEDAGSRVQGTRGVRVKPSDFPNGAENELVIGISEKPTQR